MSRVEGVLFDLDDTPVGLFSAPIYGFRQLTDDDSRHIPESMREQVAKDYADEGAVADEHNMADELTLMGQRAEWICQVYGLGAMDVLDALSIPYGAVSNIVARYQRNKLRLSGLERIGVLVGSDTAGAPKPDPRPFHAGYRLLGTGHSVTLYVEDNPIIDVLEARGTGPQAKVLRRASDHNPNSAETR